MSEYLPTGGFHKPNVSNKIRLLKTISRMPDKNEYGFFIECDLEYPSSIHNKRNFFAFLPEKKNNKSRKYLTLFDEKQTGKI